MTGILDSPFFHHELAAHSELERLRWPLIGSGGCAVCPHCGATDRVGDVTGKGARAALKVCGHCRKQFRATMGTIFESSHVLMHKWFQATFLLTSTMRGISANHLHSAVRIEYLTALRVRKRIELAIGRVSRPYSVPRGFDHDKIRTGGFVGAAEMLGFNPEPAAFEATMSQVVRHRPERLAHYRRAA
jgi:transposase-like protein